MKQKEVSWGKDYLEPRRREGREEGFLLAFCPRRIFNHYGRHLRARLKSRGNVGAGKKVSFVGLLAIIGQNDWGQNGCSLAKVQKRNLRGRT